MPLLNFPPVRTVKPHLKMVDGMWVCRGDGLVCRSKTAANAFEVWRWRFVLRDHSRRVLNNRRSHRIDDRLYFWGDEPILPKPRTLRERITFVSNDQELVA